MTQLWFGLVALFALVVFFVFLGSLRKWPVLGVVSIAANVLIAWELPYPPALANVGGSNFYFLDILCTAFLLIGITRLPRLTVNIGGAAWLWLALGCLLGVSLLQGVVENSFGTTMNEFRSFFYPYAAMTWAMSLAWSPALTRSLIQRFSMALGWGLVIVAVLNISRFGLGSPSGLVDPGTGIEQNTRPLISGQAFMLLMCAAVCLRFWHSQRRPALFANALVFLCVVVAVQQRTVWGVAILVVIAVFLVSQPRTKLTMLYFGLIASCLAGIAVTTNVAPSLLSEFGGAASDSRTYDARVTSWTNLIAQSVSQGPYNVLFGEPMGDGFGRFEGINRWVVFAPHNWYVSIYLRVGLLGLSVLVLFLAFVITRMLRRQSNMASVAILTAMVSYGWSYSWIWYFGIFSGWALANRSTDQVIPPDSASRVISLDLSRG
jgi:hypothetical protein